MRSYSLTALLFVASVLGSFSDSAGAGDKKKDATEAFLLVVPPTGGKEIKVADWRFTFGTRRFDPTKDSPKNPKSKTPSGPEYLEFRDDRSTTYQDGILTLIPLQSLRKIEYDREKKSVAVVVSKADGKDETLAGTTKFVGLNKITLSGDAVLEGLGSAAVKFQGGSPDGLRSVRFPQPVPADPVKGAEAIIIARDKEKTQHTAYGLEPLYLIDGVYRVLPHLMFKKTVKIDLDKIAKLRHFPSEDKKQLSSEFEGSLRDGNKHTLTIRTAIEGEKKKGNLFVGLVGRVPVGYKIFPAHAIQELRMSGDEKK